MKLSKNWVKYRLLPGDDCTTHFDDNLLGMLELSSILECPNSLGCWNSLAGFLNFFEKLVLNSWLFWSIAFVSKISKIPNWCIRGGHTWKKPILEGYYINLKKYFLYFRMKIWNNYGLITIIFALSMMIDKSTWRYYLLLSGGDHNCGIIIYNFGNFSQTYFPRKIPPRFENIIFHHLSAFIENTNACRVCIKIG